LAIIAVVVELPEVKFLVEYIVKKLLDCASMTLSRDRLTLLIEVRALRRDVAQIYFWLWRHFPEGLAHRRREVLTA